MADKQIAEPYRADDSLLGLKKDLTAVLGDSGTERYYGYIQEEFNSKWLNETRIDTVEEMRRADGSVKALLRAIKTPMLATQWRVECENKEIQQFVEENLFENLERSWKEFLREALCYLDFGHYVFEQIYEVRDGKIWLKDLAPRIPASIFRWKLTNGEFGIIQNIRTDDAKQHQAEIPADKLLILTNDKEGDDVTGQSLLRPAYIHWKMKNVLYRVSAIAAERYGVGIPVLYIPKSSDAEEKAKAENAVMNVRSNEKSYLVFSGTEEEWKFKIVTPEGNPQGANIIELIEHHDKRILSSGLAGFIGLGSGDTGSFALSKTLLDWFIRSVEDNARYFAEQMEQQVIWRLVQLNFGDKAECPKLLFQSIKEVNFKEFATVLQTLASTNLINVDEEVKEWIHEQFMLPKYNKATDKKLGEPIPTGEPKKDVADMTDEELEAEQKRKEAAGEDTTDEAEELSERLKKKHSHSLTERLYAPARALTFQENRLGMERLNQQFNNLQGDMETRLIATTEREIDRILSDETSRISSGRVFSDALPLFTNVNDVIRIFRDVAKKSYNIGKAQASREVGADRPATLAEENELMDLTAQQMAQDYTDEMDKSAKRYLADAIAKGAALIAILARLRQNAQEDAARMITNSSGMVPATFMNRGRQQVFAQNMNKILNYQRTEVLDDVTCNICLSMDGLVISPSDPMLNLDLVHTHCRGTWVPIMGADPEQPDETGIPEGVRSQFETVDGKPVVNHYKQLKRPIQRPENIKAYQIVQSRIKHIDDKATRAAQTTAKQNAGYLKTEIDSSADFNKQYQAMERSMLFKDAKGEDPLNSTITPLFAENRISDIAGKLDRQFPDTGIGDEFKRRIKKDDTTLNQLRKTAYDVVKERLNLDLNGNI